MVAECSLQAVACNTMMRHRGTERWAALTSKHGWDQQMPRQQAAAESQPCCQAGPQLVPALVSQLTRSTSEQVVPQHALLSDRARLGQCPHLAAGGVCVRCSLAASTRKHLIDVHCLAGVCACSTAER